MDVKPCIPPHLTTKQRILFLHRMGYPALKKMKQISIEKFNRRILATSVVQLGGFLYVKISPAISYFSFSKNALLRKNPAY